MKPVVLASLLCGLALLPARPVRACDTPVYRFALDNWPADSYRATVLHRGPLSSAEQRLVEQLTAGAKSANLTVQVINGDAPDPARELDLADGPVLVVSPPASATNPTVPWSVRLSVDAVAGLLDSPVRRQAASRLQGGEIVWLLLESGRRADDDAAAKLIADNGPAVPPSSVLRLRRDDPAEQVLVRILLGSEPDLAGRADPMAFPVFGRGRLLYALVGAGITAENVRRAAAFLGGDCSCTVKRDNPGTDLLLTADWGDMRPATEAQAAPARATAEPPANEMNWSRTALWVAVVFAGGLVVLTGTLALRSRKSQETTEHTQHTEEEP
jgi:hypothetical protein